jgi:hypothetical protein
MDSAWEQEILAFQLGLPHPFRYGIAGLFGDFELYRLLGLLLHDRRPFENMVAMGDIPDFQFDQVAAPELAVYGQVEQGKFPGALAQLQPDPDFPYFLQF